MQDDEHGFGGETAVFSTFRDSITALGPPESSVRGVADTVVCVKIFRPPFSRGNVRFRAPADAGLVEKFRKISLGAICA